METESSNELLARLGMDGKLWAEEFCKRFLQCNVDDVLGWCCNMIMTGYDRGKVQIEAETRQKCWEDLQGKLIDDDEIANFDGWLLYPTRWEELRQKWEIDK